MSSINISILVYKVIPFSLPFREESNTSTKMSNNYRHSMSCFGKVYNPRQIYEIIGRYWASEDEFDYPMTRHDPYNDVIVHVMQQE